MPSKTTPPEQQEYVQCFYVGDPRDPNCRDCDGFTPIGQVGSDGLCVAYREGPPPADWDAFYESQSVNEESSVLDGSAPSLAANVVASVSEGLAETVTLQAEIGITRQIKTSDGSDMWIKANYSEVRKLKATEDVDLAHEREALWGTVAAEVQAKLDELTDQY